MAREPNASARPTDGDLAHALERLEQCLNAEVPGREKPWAEQLGGALRGLEAILTRHIETTEAADGMFQEVDLTRPTLTRKVGQLRREHQTLRQCAVELRQQLDEAARAFQPSSAALSEPLPEPPGVAAVVDFASIRPKVEELVARLKKHQSGEVDVLLESVDTDIGVGD